MTVIASSSFDYTFAVTAVIVAIIDLKFYYHL